MASTRNRNTAGNYAAEQSGIQTASNYYSYETSPYYAAPKETYFPGDGLIGMKSAHRNLSDNYSDVESFLFGIGSTNLVSPKSEPTPELQYHKSLNIMDKTPVILPEKLKIQSNQRNMFLN